MEDGKYTKKPFNFSQFDCRKFPFVLWDLSIYGLAGCYANLLASIVGKEDPWKIRKINKNKDSGDDKFITSYLRKNGFKVIPLTKCMVSNRRHEMSNLDGFLKPYNVIISSNLVKKNECSWFASWGGKYLIHNQEISPMSVLDQYNFPTHTAYLLFHNKYK